MSFDILNRWTRAIAYHSESASDVRAAVLEAINSGADLREADLSGAYLSGAYLRGAYLRGADLRGADLITIRDDFWSVLAAVPEEIPALRIALIKGRVDGSTYQGPCACLVGTIANAKHCAYDNVPGLAPNSSRPAERFFLGITKGSTPETSQFSKLAVEWLDDFDSRMKAAYAK